jgi:uncharacterized membrane protein (DUF2068 family)
VPGDPVPRAAEPVAERPGGWKARLWIELSSTSPPHDPFIKLVILERFSRGLLLAAAAAALLVLGELGDLQTVISAVQQQVDLETGSALLRQLLTRALDQLGSYPHRSGLAIGVLLFSALEVLEAVGLARRRRWAEYLTVLATGVLIPLEVVEVARRPTPFRVGALALNVAIVAWLAYRKRLFVGVLSPT